MSDRSPDGPQPGSWVPPPADATRDIKLPPLPGRPGPAVPPEWSRYVPVDRPAPQAAAAGAGPSAATAETVVGVGPPARGGLDLPTDRLAAPRERPRSSTLSFQPPPQVQLLKVSVGPRRRSQWIWAVLITLPVLVIVGAGIWLFLLLNGA